MKTDEDDKVYDTVPDFRTEMEDLLVLLLEEQCNGMPESKMQGHCNGMRESKMPSLNHSGSFGDIDQSIISTCTLSNQNSGCWKDTQYECSSLSSAGGDTKLNVQMMIWADVFQDYDKIIDPMFSTLANLQDFEILPPAHEINVKTEANDSCAKNDDMFGHNDCNFNETGNSSMRPAKRSSSSEIDFAKKVPKVTPPNSPAEESAPVVSTKEEASCCDKLSNELQHTPVQESSHLISPTCHQQNYSAPVVSSNEEAPCCDKVANELQHTPAPESSHLISPSCHQQNYRLQIETTNLVTKAPKKSIEHEVGESMKKNRTCEKEGCLTTRHFGYVGESARFCFCHKEDGMINLSIRKCMECSRTASFGLLQTKLKQYCKEHKKPEHINLSLKKCTIGTCPKTANYGFQNKPLQFCSSHKCPGMQLRRKWKDAENEGTM